MFKLPGDKTRIRWSKLSNIQVLRVIQTDD